MPVIVVKKLNLWEENDVKAEKILPVIVAVTLLTVTISGCVQGGATQKGYAKNDDCLFCHASSGTTGKVDISRYYVNNEAHHKVGVAYPLGSAINEDFYMPTGLKNDFSYFDQNNNGRPDIEEIRVFITNGVALITCASCHREHEKSPIAREEPDDDYLRGTNESSQMCLTCHRK